MRQCRSTDGPMCPLHLWPQAVVKPAKKSAARGIDRLTDTFLLKPCHLLLGVMPSVEFYLCHRMFHRIEAIEDGEEFAIAHRSQGIQVAVVLDASHLVDQAVRHHEVDPAVDSLTQGIGFEH